MTTAESMLVDFSSKNDKLPPYSTIDFDVMPPDYTPSLHHLSLIYYNDESNCDGKVSYIPLLFEINSTQINFYHLKPEYSRYIAHLFNDLHSTFVDPNLNIKSKNASKVNIIGQGIGSSTSLFHIPDLNNSNSNILLKSLKPISPPTLMTSDSSINSSFSSSSSSSSSCSSSLMFSSSSQSSTSSFSNHFSNYTPSISRTNSSASSSITTTSNSLSKLFGKFSLKRQKSEDEYSFNSIVLTDIEKKSQDLIYLQKLMNFKPDINSILDTDYTPEEAQMLTFKSNLFKSYSLQELIKFGNASDFHSKPFTLRLIFPTDQFVMVSYNANAYASIFYKLNVAKELSLDFDLRIALPTDYCVPRRSRGNRHRRNRQRNNSLTTPVSRTTTRSRSNSLLDQDDDEDEFDTTFNIETQPQLDYQPQQSIQPQIILEDEILNDIIQLEPAQQTLSSLSYVSRVTTTSNSVFSSVERFTSQATDTTMLSSLSPISSRNEDVDADGNSIFNSTTISELLPIDKIPDDNFPQTKYKELVFAIKCIRSCKNKTIPWTK
ncbi:hypothetical protein C6P40_004920 [Pichia californica]|uniref:Uncharacterized protein n=1 Tax=Pichia californica TaxID=460514 RepID=A0A9P6WM82_9ASCO|nr:hypothetical protein C6P42_004332 [[Candida] californica]KAG0689504.1 hypothetical protein C6P40_004920 [[Candida] californica]